MKTEESVIGAGPKKVGRPAPQITVVRSTVARVPRPKTDPRQRAGTGTILIRTGTILSGTCAILSGTCAINQQRQDRDSIQNPVAEGKPTKGAIFRQRKDRNNTQNPVAGR